MWLPKQRKKRERVAKKVDLDGFYQIGKVEIVGAFVRSF